MKGALALRKPLGSFWLSIASNNVNVGAWLQLIAKLPAPASAILFTETSGHLWKVSTGTAGNEAASLQNFYITPNGLAVLVPVELKSGLPFTVSPLDANATTGLIAVTLFG